MPRTTTAMAVPARLPHSFLICIVRLPDVPMTGACGFHRLRRANSLSAWPQNPKNFARRVTYDASGAGAPARGCASTKMGPDEGAVSRMWKATIRGLVARKVRLALTALAILLGVSFVSATYVLTDTVRQSFDAVFAQTLSGVDLKVQGASALGDVSDPGRIPDTTVDQVSQVPGVRRAEGFLQTTLAQFVDSVGEVDRWRGTADARDLVGRPRSVAPHRRAPARRAAAGRDGRRHRRRGTGSRSATPSASC